MANSKGGRASHQSSASACAPSAQHAFHADYYYNVVPSNREGVRRQEFLELRKKFDGVRDVLNNFTGDHQIEMSCVRGVEVEQVFSSNVIVFPP